MRFGLVPRFALVCFCLSVAAAWSQDTTATIIGALTDSSGAVLPGVTINIRHVETSQTRTVVSDDGGRFRAPLLQPGHYEVTAMLTGFQTVVRSGLTLTVGQEALLNIQMALG